MQRNSRAIVIGMLGVGMLCADTAWAGEERQPAGLQVPDGPGITAVATRSAGRAGQVFNVDVYISNVPDLGAYQVKLKVTGGTQGTLTMQDAAIDRSRKDFVFGTDQIIDAVAKDTGVLLAAKNIPIRAGSTAISKPRYAGTFEFLASPDAKGVFSISVEKGPAASMMNNTVGQTMLVEAGPAATITVGAVLKRSSSDR